MLDNLDLEPLLIVLGLIACAAFTLWSVLAALRDWLFPSARNTHSPSTDIEFDTGHPLSMRAGHPGSPSCDDDGD